MTTLSIRIDSELKKSAEDTLEKMGMTPSQAIRILFKQIVNFGCFPFIPSIEKPNERLLQRLKEDESNYTEVENFNEILDGLD